jgi:glycosyltransferase involved in cell wall biosynthesis
MIAPEPFLVPRGTPISVYQRLVGLAALGHTVDLVTYHLGEPVTLPGVTIHRIPALPGIRQVRPGPSTAKAFLDILLFLKALWMLTRWQYDVIHTHEEASHIGLILSKLFDLNHLYDMHSSLPRQLHSNAYGDGSWPVRLFSWLERKVVRSADAIITIDQELDGHVRELHPEANTATIQNLPIQLTESTLHASGAQQLRERYELDGRQIVLYTGTFEPYQGLDLLMSSAERLIRDHPQLSFVLVGGNDGQVAHCRQMAADRRLGEHFRFAGTVPITEIPAYLALASILVSPRLEGTSVPMKLYTYLLSGKPLVATRTAGHVQVLTDEIALLAEPEAEAFASAIARLLEDPGQGERLAARARLFAQDRHSFASYVESLDRIYRTLTPRRVIAAPAAAALEK